MGVSPPLARHLVPGIQDGLACAQSELIEAKSTSVAQVDAGPSVHLAEASTLAMLAMPLAQPYSLVMERHVAYGYSLTNTARLNG